MPNLVKLNKGYLPKAFDNNKLQQIQAAADRLFVQLQQMNLASFQLLERSKIYFNKCHIQRLHFSLECSAYNIIWGLNAFPNRAISELTILDYGAGLGTQYLLAKACGFKAVYYNDYDPEWCSEAMAFCKHLQLDLDAYLPGDIRDVQQVFQAENKTVDIVISRNVIEHLPDLSHYYSTLALLNTAKISVVDSTSANTNNPLVLLNHIRKHLIVERKLYLPARLKMIQEWASDLTPAEQNQLAQQTREYWGDGLHKIVEKYRTNKVIQVSHRFKTNTCNPVNGIWYERILTDQQYGKLLSGAGFKAQIQPGFWDTHYKIGVINVAFKLLNYFIRMVGLKGRPIAPFMIIVSSIN